MYLRNYLDRTGNAEENISELTNRGKKKNRKTNVSEPGTLPTKKKLFTSLWIKKS